MTESEITTLAHEYAEEIYHGDTDFIDEAENMLTWLLRRYCLVEKEFLKEVMTLQIERINEDNKGSEAWFFHKERQVKYVSLPLPRSRKGGGRMTKKNRLRRAWQRNWKLWMVKGIYSNMGKPWKNWLTPKQVIKELLNENNSHSRRI